MAALYCVLVEADASKQPDQEKKSAARKTDKPAKREATKTNKDELPPKQQPVNPTSDSKGFPAAPGVHINLEIHISADSTADQIDQIFAAMAKHIYQRA